MICENIELIKQELSPYKADLIAVSKTQPVNKIKEAIDCGQLNFGENYVQELSTKSRKIDTNVRWHMIGHLQTNKVKFVAPFVGMIQTVDSIKLLREINKEAIKNNRTIEVLLQIFIASEQTKYGLLYDEADALFGLLAKEELPNIKVKGLMGMASFTDNLEQVEKEFSGLYNYFEKSGRQKSGNISMDVLCMGMSSDYKIALNCGSNMVRIGSAIFGQRL